MNRKGHTPAKHCGSVRRVVLLRKLSLFGGGFLLCKLVLLQRSSMVCGFGEII